MLKKITAAVVAIGAGLSLLIAPTAHSAAEPDDCQLVARTDVKLCRTVQAQHAYGAINDNGHGAWSAPNGRALVREITHQGLSKAEMRNYLQGEARNYRRHVTAVPVNMDTIVKRCGNTDGYWKVQLIDEDNKPGGRKLTIRTIVCA